jgi:hypothetical protein
MAGKSLAALDASLGDLEEQWAAESRWLNPEELAEAEKAIAAGSQDEETRAESLKDLLACMTVAEGA